MQARRIWLEFINSPDGRETLYVILSLSNGLSSLLTYLVDANECVAPESINEYVGMPETRMLPDTTEGLASASA